MKSKKRSAANSRSKPPKFPVFFVDRSLGKKKVPSALRQAGAQVEIHDDHFPPDEKDKVWLQEVGRKGWLVLTKDRKIRYRGPEVAALAGAGVGAFVLRAGNVQGQDMGQIFVKALPAMKRFAAKTARPFIVSVAQSGRLTKLYP